MQYLRDKQTELWGTGKQVFLSDIHFTIKQVKLKNLRV